MMAAYDLIIFDCDGVLVDSEPIANRIFAEEVRRLGYPLSDEEARREFPGTSLAYCINYTERKFGIKLPEDLGLIYRQKSFEAFTRELEAVPGIPELIHALTIPYCVASNGPMHKMEHNLRIVGLYDRFAGKLFSAYEIDQFKPEPGLFLYAAAQMGAEPSRCLVIEDSIHGIHAALSAGMDIWAYSHDHNEQEFRDAGARTFRSIKGMQEAL